jgi:hypothetical protein
MIIGQYAKETSFANVPEDVYPGRITSFELEMENNTPKVDAYGKNRVIIKVRLHNEVDEEGNPIVLRRSLPVSYGQNIQTQKWSDLAVLTRICTGIPEGDPQQKQIADSDYVNKDLRVKTVNVQKNGSVYTNIDAFMPPERQGRPQQQSPSNGQQQPTTPAHQNSADPNYYTPDRQPNPPQGRPARPNGNGAGQIPAAEFGRGTAPPLPPRQKSQAEIDAEEFAEFQRAKAAAKQQTQAPAPNRNPVPVAAGEGYDGDPYEEQLDEFGNPLPEIPF